MHQMLKLSAKDFRIAVIKHVLTINFKTPFKKKKANLSKDRNYKRDQMKITELKR